MNMKEKYGFFGPVTLVYALVFVFCTYQNTSGVTWPIFVAASLVYLCLVLGKLEKPLKKENLFYMISMVLLGVSTFCTDDGRLIVMNKTGIFVLMMVLLLQQFFDTKDWQLKEYLHNILNLTVCGLGEVMSPYRDGYDYCKEKNKILNKKIIPILLGLAAAIPLLFIVILLLGSADAVFREVTDSILNRIRVGSQFGTVVNILFRILVFFSIVYGWLKYLTSGKMPGEVKERHKADPVIAITITGLLSVTYLYFCGIQVVYLFFGRMDLPDGYTYAGYAREGFFQLLAVSILNLVIVLAANSCFRESKVLKGILTVMSFCTFIMILSSALRMIMYIRYYYLTFLRIFVLWSLAVLFVLFVGVLVHIYRPRFPLFRYGLMVLTVCYLALSFSHPDYLIARVNVANTAGGGFSVDSYGQEIVRQEGDFFQNTSPYQDYLYLSTLSADAAPVLIPFLEETGCSISAFYEEDVLGAAEGTSYMAQYMEKLSRFGYYYLENMKEETEDFGFRTYNVSRHMMLRLVEKYSYKK